MLDYADPLVEYMSEGPRTSDEMTPIHKNTRYGEVVCAPVQIIREGDWAGVWRLTKIWRNGVFIGYVRIDTIAQTVRTRLPWANRELSAVLSIKPGLGAMSVPTALKHACEILTLVYAANVTSALNRLTRCVAVSPEGLQCTAVSAHVRDEPAHVDEAGHVWYD